MGRYAQSYGIYIAIVVLAVGFLVYRWIQTEAGATTVDKIRIGLPVIGNVWLKYQVGLFLADAVPRC